jgi:hypothetical protein
VTEETFWWHIDQSRADAGSDLERQVSILETRLTGLELPELLEFHAHFEGCLDRAFHWDLWAAAYIVRGGCSDDAFLDFRGSLIALGQKTFESVVQDSDSLRDLLDRLCLDDPEEELFVEGFSDLARTVYRRSEPLGRLPVLPSKAEPGGVPWSDQNDDLAKRCPRLWNRCGPKDDSAERALAAARQAFAARDFARARAHYSKVTTALASMDQQKLRYCIKSTS